MQIVQELAGYSLGGADLMRRVISKKKMAQMEIERENFIYGKKDENGNQIIDGCVNRGIDEKTAIAIFDEIYDFANYAFNKSHAAAYAYVTYQTAYLKTFYPVEFMASLISSVDDTDKVNEYIANSKSMGITLCPPDVNKSTDTFIVEGNSIRFGLTAVKNVGRTFVQSLVEERNRNGEYSTFSDFISRMTGNDMNKRAVEGMIMCGAFDSFGIKRSQLMQVFESAIENEAQSKKGNLSGQLTLFDDNEETIELEFPDIDEFDKNTLLKMEKQSIGMYLSGNPMEKYEDKIRSITKYNIATVVNSVEKNEDGAYIMSENGVSDGEYVKLCGVISARKNKTTRNNTQMAFLKLEDAYGVIEVLVFPKILTQFSELLSEENIILAEGRVSLREDEEPKLLLERATLLDLVNPPAKQKTLYIKLQQKNVDTLAKYASLANQFGGSTPVCLYFEQTKERLLAPENLKINPTDEAIEALKYEYGEKNVVLK